MCSECGCGLPGEKPATISAHTHDHDHDHDHGHPHHHDHDHDHGHGHTHDHVHADAGDTSISPRRTLDLHRAILEKNNYQAERNRGFFRARGLLVLNILSSPGSGKTTLIRETIRALQGRLKVAVIVGDLATDNDARRLREAPASVVQINTGTVCHLEAEMVARATKQLDLTGLDLLIIENVGNLVCPASYDLGEDLRVVLLSVTDGEDKPLKYPPMFQSAGAAVVSKMDLAQICGYDREAALGNLHRLAPRAPVFELSSKTGQGLDVWCAYLVQQHKAVKTRDPLSL